MRLLKRPSDNAFMLARCRSLAAAALLSASGSESTACGPLTVAERAKLGHCPLHFVTALERLVGHLRPTAAPASVAAAAAAMPACRPCVCGRHVTPTPHR